MWLAMGCGAVGYGATCEGARACSSGSMSRRKQVDWYFPFDLRSVGRRTHALAITIAPSGALPFSLSFGSVQYCRMPFSRLNHLWWRRRRVGRETCGGQR